MWLVAVPRVRFSMRVDRRWGVSHLTCVREWRKYYMKYYRKSSQMFRGMADVHSLETSQMFSRHLKCTGYY